MPAMPRPSGKPKRIANTLLKKGKGVTTKKDPSDTKKKRQHGSMSTDMPSGVQI